MCVYIQVDLCIEWALEGWEICVHVSVTKFLSRRDVQFLACSLIVYDTDCFPNRILCPFFFRNLTSQTGEKCYFSLCFALFHGQTVDLDIFHVTEGHFLSLFLWIVWSCLFVGFSFSSSLWSQTWQHMPVILALKRKRQRDCDFELAWAIGCGLVSRNQNKTFHLCLCCSLPQS